MKICQEVNPNLRLFRARFSSVTQADIRRAINSLAQPDIKYVVYSIAASPPLFFYKRLIVREIAYWSHIFIIETHH